RELRDHFTTATLKEVNSWDDEHKISGKAHFIDSKTVQVNQQQYQAKSVIIAVGSTPTINSDWKNELGDRLLSSDQIFELETLPKSLAVIGSGVIAIELAQAMQRLGVETIIFARSCKVGSLTSPKLQKIAQTTLSEELNIKFETLPEQVKKFRNKVKINYIEKGTQSSFTADYLLVATGRNSYLDSLSLENIDSKFTDLKKLPVDMRTKQLADYPIFIIGDAHSNSPIQHEAAHEGRTVIHNCLNFPKLKNI